MARHLLVLSLGPVQDFIAQARRTRDLWFGSELLSQLSHRVADTARQLGATLLFPAIEQLASDKGRSPGVANKVLAITPDDPRPLVERARHATREHLHDLWRQVTSRKEVAALLDPQAHEAAGEQLDTFLELFAAWAPWKEGTPYHEVLHQVEQALAARKSLHAFTPWRQQQRGRHKSSLDGARESVLRRPEERTGPGWHTYRIGQREELDAIGLLKRTSPQPGQFVPVPSIGLSDWIEHASEHHGELLAKLRRYCTDHDGHFTPVKRDAAWVRAFPFDAQVLLPDRWRPYFEDIGLDPREAPRFGGQYVQPLLEAMRSDPFPFVACLVADGDRMGETLQKLAEHHGHERHQALSRALSDFSRQALRIVEQQHRGILVYAGGDDVLAFLCPPDALECAEALHRAFGETVSGALHGTDVVAPTLSVGLGVGHVLESLGDLLELGRRAGHMAKEPDRNGLALLMARRGGQERSWRCRWEARPVDRLREDMHLLESERVGLGKLHEVETVLRRLPLPEDIRPEERWEQVLTHEVQRLLSRARAGLGATGPKPEEVGLALSGDYAARRRSVEAWMERLLVAEELSRARRHRHRARQAGAA